MALLDLSSDLSRFRSEVSREEKNTPESSKATNNKNFATFQPITEKLSSFSPTINRPEQVKPLESRLSSTKLDDIRKFAQENLLMNSVSKYSSVNMEYSEQTLGRISTEQIKSRFNKIQQTEFVSNLYKSNVVIVKPSGDKNTKSPVNIPINKNDSSDNIENPNLVITAPPLSVDRTKTSPNITKNINEAVGNITNPNIVINKIPLTFQRDTSSPKIVINKSDAIDNITNPNIDILGKPLSFDRNKETPNIITDTIKSGLVVNPNTDVIKIQQGTFHLEDESNLDLNGAPIKFVKESRLVNKQVTPIKDTEKYEGISQQLTDNSELNLDSVIKTIPYGRNDDPNKSKFSIKGVQSVNFFKDDNASGFVVNAQKGESNYKEGSLFVWKGNGTAAPSVNFMPDINAKGFQKFVNLGETLYKTQSSKFGFISTPQVDFFDSVKKYTSEGFKIFTTLLQTAYQPDASLFGWAGKRTDAPEANYFDREFKNTNAGFHRFAQIYDTKYITDSSVFDWDGKRTDAPEVNYFDIAGRNTTAGFHRFAEIYDTKYITDSSVFDWDGKRTDAPEVNYFDITGKNTTAGFHRFAQIYDTKYIHESSIFDWDGIRTDAPEVNYFDITGKNTTAGFHRFAQIYDTKYIHESSIFDWDGVRTDAPEVNYFDISGKNTTAGFHRFAQLYDTKYVHESSIFDWDGVRTDAPEVNYFDITGRNTTAGFHRFAQLYDTKYVHESSIFDWDGKRPDAPFVNYFDISGKNTTAGFHTFAQLYDTKYVHESSIFDWDGKRPDAPFVNYFDISGKNTTAGFHTFAQLYDTKYVHESSIFDWDGKRPDAPFVNYFDISGKNTTAGFHTFAQIYDTKYVHESSIFDWDGARTQAPEVNYFDISGKFTTKGFHRLAELYDSKYVKESSRFDWDGTRSSAPEVNYFDISGKFTTKGFHKLAELYDSKYVKNASRFDWDGERKSAPSTNFFQDRYAPGFKTFTEKLKSEYVKDSSEFTFKGSEPKPVDFFSNTNASGFINKIPALESKYNKDASRFTFKGSQPNPVDFFPNDNANGFTIKINQGESKYAKESSRYTFKGTRSSAPSVDYINNDYANGFTNLTPYLKTEYSTNIFEQKSRFSWVGSKLDAPSVDFFKIPAKNESGISGFDTFFTDRTATRYSDKLSSLSAESSTKKSAVKNIPYTTFFGYRPQERTGFMVNMSTFDGTLFPIINPRLKFDSDLDTRTKLSIIRSENPANLKTGELENYAPLSLGKRPWANGTLFSTLDSQIPNLKTNAPAGSYINKYERSLKDNTNKVGYLTKWATTRKSPSPLDEQYSKYKLQKESTNSEPAFFYQPYVVRGIQRIGEVENQRWGFGVNFDDGIVRGGVTTQAERILMDVVRLGKWNLSVKGLLFNVRQFGLQAMNPAIDVDPDTPSSRVLGVSSTLLYNPLSLIGNVATARAGAHFARHGINPLDSDYLNKYEKATRNRELKQRFTDRSYKSFDGLITPNEVLSDPPRGYNRLIGLMKEMLPMSFAPMVNASPTATNASSLASKAKQFLAELTFGKGRIARISSLFGGAQSYFGIGGTDIRKSSHPYLTFYTTSPNLFTGKEPQYLDSAKRESFFGAIAETRYQDRLEKESADLNNKDFYGIILALSQLVNERPLNPIKETPSVTLKENIPVQKETKDRIQKLNSFNPKYDAPSNRLKNITSNNATRNGSELYLGPSNLSTDYNSNPIKKYRTLAYNKLQKVKPGTAGRSALFNDFRHDLELTGSETFVTNPNFARYETRNLQDYYGLGKQGKPGAQRNIPFKSNVEYAETGNGVEQTGPKEFRSFALPVLKSKSGDTGSYYEFRGDRINIIDYKRANFGLNTSRVYEKDPKLKIPDTIPGTRDLVDFYFTSLVLAGHGYCPAEVIVFRATFDSVQDSHNPSWNAVKYMGRADPLYVYQGYERSISFGFTVHIGSRDEMKATWRKLNYLASWTAPEYRNTDGLIRGPMCRLNIGNLYRKMPGFISSLSYTFDNTNGYWETAGLKEDQNLAGGNKDINSPGVLQLPKYIQVSVGFTPVGVYRPEKNGVMYSLYDDTGVDVENGLMPTGNNKVNYFRTFDNLTMEHELNKAGVTSPVTEVTKVLTDDEIQKQFDQDRVVSPKEGDADFVGPVRPR